MRELTEQFRLVILESPIDTWTDPRVPELFSQAIGLRLQGFNHEYPYGCLPFDTTDFIADHMLICRENNGRLEPALCVKTTFLKKCRLHKIVFPAIGLARAASAPDHEHVLEEIIADLDQKGRDFAYIGSWTIGPEYRQNKTVSAHLRELFVTMYARHHQEAGYPALIAAGVTKFKVDELLVWMGHRPLELNDQALPCIGAPHLDGAPVKYAFLTEFSREILAVAEKWELLWRNRIHIAGRRMQVEENETKVNRVA